jgi:hypothetical protein
MSERQFAMSGRWALAADSLQWMLQRQYMNKGQVCWRSVSFVSSTRDILARCMREKGCPSADAERLLAGLPATFEEWGRAPAQSCIETILVEGEASAPKRPRHSPLAAANDPTTPTGDLNDPEPPR